MAHSIRDLALSIAYYFCCLFGFEDAIAPTVTQLPKIDVLRYLPYDFDEMLRRLREMWPTVFNWECFVSYLEKVAELVNDFSVILMLLIPVVILLWVIGKWLLLLPNSGKHGEQTKAMRFFEGKPLAALIATREWLTCLFHTFMGYKRYLWPIALLWLLNFNVLTIIVGVLAYYFYFAIAFDFLNLLTVQICKILLDVVIMLASAPILFWIGAAFTVICIVRRNMGYKRLNAFEARNVSFISAQPICLLVCGLMGSKKTTMITDIALSEEVRFRESALELLMEQDAKYPNFPWINLEDKLKDAFRHHKIYSLTTARDWVRKKEQRFLRCPERHNIFGYNIDRYRYEYDNKLRIETIWDVIEHYAEAYLIYTIQSTLILSNYSIRTDNVCVDNGNFPIWSNTFFRKNPRESWQDSRFAHILDYDLLRLGKQMLEDNPNRGSFEFGVVVMTEIGKERGNTLTLQELKKKVDECNQKNDLFNYSLKMARHRATVCGIPFIRIISDEQRAESLGADARDLFSVIHIRESSPFRLVMPFYFIEEIIHETLYPMFRNFNISYKFNRGDICYGD